LRLPVFSPSGDCVERDAFRLR